jgi:hypothetical protein
MSESASSTLEPPARRVSPWRRAGLGVLVVVLGLVAVGLVQEWRGVRNAGTELERMTRTLDEEDPGWRLEDLNVDRPTFGEGENSAVLVAAVAGRVPGNWPPQEVFPPEGTPVNQRLDAARLARLVKELQSLEGLRVEALRLAELPRGRHRLSINVASPFHTRLVDQQQSRRVGHLLNLDAVERAHRGDLASALRACRAGINAGRSLGDEPLIISQLIRFALVLQAADAVERCLALGEAPERELAELQRLLADEEKHEGTYHALRGERAALHQIMQNLADGSLRLDDLGPDGIPPELRIRERIAGWTVRDQARRENVLMLRLANRAVEITRLPETEQAKAERALDREVRQGVVQAPFVRFLFPALLKVSEAGHRKRALMRCLVVLLAVERYRLKHGTWPDKLEALKPDFLAAVPLDPFDGKPVRYLHHAGGVIVYTVGMDGRDDGGKVDRDRSFTRGTDLGYRLWDVAGRNQPGKP